MPDLQQTARPLKLVKRGALRIRCEYGLQGPLVGDDALYFSDHAVAITRVRRGTLEIDWSVEAEGFGIEAISGDHLVISSLGKGGVGAMDTRTGQVLWKSSPGIWFSHKDGALATCAVNGREVSIVDPADGSPKSVCVLPEGMTLFRLCLPVVIGCIVRENTKRTFEMCAVDQRTGDVLWTADIERALRAETPGLTATSFMYEPVTGHLLAILPDRIVAFDLKSADRTWEAAVPRTHRISIFEHGNRLYAYNFGLFTCIERDSGRIVFQTRHSDDASKFRSGTDVATPAGVDGDRLAYVTRMGLRVFDMNTGDLLAEYADWVFEGRFVDGRYVLNRGTRVVHVVEYPKRTLVKPATGPAKPRAFRVPRLTAEVLGDDHDTPLLFDKLHPLAIEGFESLNDPIARDGAVIVTGSPAGMARLAAGTYELMWKAKLDAAIGDVRGGCIVGRNLAERRVIGWSLEDGQRRWTTESQSGAWWPSGDLIVTSPDEPQELRLVDPHSGATLLTFFRRLPHVVGVTEGVAVTSHAIARAYGLVRSALDPFGAVDLRDGRQVWERDLIAEMKKALAAADPDSGPRVVTVRAGVLVFEADARYLGYSAHSGERLWEAGVPARTVKAFVAHDCLWVASYTPATLYCIDVKTGAVSERATNGVTPVIVGTFRDYVVTSRSPRLTFYHRTRPTQVLPLKSGGGDVTDVYDDLWLSENRQLRGFRLVKEI